MGRSDGDTSQPLEWTRRQLLLRGGPMVTAMLALIGCHQKLPEVPSAHAGDPRDAGTDAQDAKPIASTDASTDAGRDADAPRETGPPPAEYSSWSAVRRQFELVEDLVHMAGMMLATHPKPVREAIETHREGLNANPVDYLFEHWARTEGQLDEDAEQQAMEAVADFLGAHPGDIALTGSTTMGLATIYHGLEMREDQEILSGYWNHWASEGSIDYRVEQTGVERRDVEWPAPVDEVTGRQLVDHLVEAISPKTRVVATTWVHSNTGLKLPVGEIGRRIDAINRDRSPENRILYCVDGVHGLGVEDFQLDDLRCDFFVAGCHKWLFGPRGTGLIAAAPEAWRHAVPTIPSFSMSVTPGRRFTPGGFHAFEHRWALAEAFEFHRRLGRDRVQRRIHALTDHLVEGLAEMDHVDLVTPTDPALRSGIVCFECDGEKLYEVLGHLDSREIVASVSPGDRSLPRLTPGLLNDHDEVDRVLEAVAAMA